jgi:hypothetical protein
MAKYEKLDELKKRAAKMEPDLDLGLRLLDWRLSFTSDLDDNDLIELINLGHSLCGIPLRVSRSTIPDSGFGLFVTEDFSENERITIYGGAFLLDDIYFMRGETGHYVVNTKSGAYVDGLMGFRLGELGRWCNTNPGHNNAGLGFFGDNGVYVQATKFISAGSEVFCDYGPSYPQDSLRSI